eukprot:3627-Chlamydomonas_euryale.AAC.3
MAWLVACRARVVRRRVDGGGGGRGGGACCEARQPSEAACRERKARHKKLITHPLCNSPLEPRPRQ